MAFHEANGMQTNFVLDRTAVAGWMVRAGDDANSQFELPLPSFRTKLALWSMGTRHANPDENASSCDAIWDFQEKVW